MIFDSNYTVMDNAFINRWVLEFACTDEYRNIKRIVNTYIVNGEYKVDNFINTELIEGFTVNDQPIPFVPGKYYKMNIGKNEYNIVKDKNGNEVGRFQIDNLFDPVWEEDKTDQLNEAVRNRINILEKGNFVSKNRQPWLTDKIKEIGHIETTAMYSAYKDKILLKETVISSSNFTDGLSRNDMYPMFNTGILPSTLTGINMSYYKLENFHFLFKTSYLDSFSDEKKTYLCKAQCVGVKNRPSDLSENKVWCYFIGSSDHTKSEQISRTISGTTAVYNNASCYEPYALLLIRRKSSINIKQTYTFGENIYIRYFEYPGTTGAEISNLRSVESKFLNNDVTPTVQDILNIGRHNNFQTTIHYYHIRNFIRQTFNVIKNNTTLDNNIKITSENILKSLQRIITMVNNVRRDSEYVHPYSYIRWFKNNKYHKLANRVVTSQKISMQFYMAKMFNVNLNTPKGVAGDYDYYNTLSETGRLPGFFNYWSNIKVVNNRYYLYNIYNDTTPYSNQPLISDDSLSEANFYNEYFNYNCVYFNSNNTSFNEVFSDAAGFLGRWIDGKTNYTNHSETGILPSARLSALFFKDPFPWLRYNHAINKCTKPLLSQFMTTGWLRSGNQDIPTVYSLSLVDNDATRTGYNKFKSFLSTLFKTVDNDRFNRAYMLLELLILGYGYFQLKYIYTSTLYKNTGIQFIELPSDYLEKPLDYINDVIKKDSKLNANINNIVLHYVLHNNTEKEYYDSITAATRRIIWVDAVNDYPSYASTFPHDVHAWSEWRLTGPESYRIGMAGKKITETTSIVRGTKDAKKYNKSNNKSVINVNNILESYRDYFEKAALGRLINLELCPFIVGGFCSHDNKGGDRILKIAYAYNERFIFRTHGKAFLKSKNLRSLNLVENNDIDSATFVPLNGKIIDTYTGNTITASDKINRDKYGNCFRVVTAVPTPPFDLMVKAYKELEKQGFDRSLPLQTSFKAFRKLGYAHRDAEVIVNGKKYYIRSISDSSIACEITKGNINTNNPVIILSKYNDAKVLSTFTVTAPSVKYVRNYVWDDSYESEVDFSVYTRNQEIALPEAHVNMIKNKMKIDNITKLTEDEKVAVIIYQAFMHAEYNENIIQNLGKYANARWPETKTNVLNSSIIDYVASLSEYDSNNNEKYLSADKALHSLIKLHDFYIMWSLNNPITIKFWCHLTPISSFYYRHDQEFKRFGVAYGVDGPLDILKANSNGGTLNYWYNNWLCKNWSPSLTSWNVSINYYKDFYYRRVVRRLSIRSSNIINDNIYTIQVGGNSNTTNWDWPGTNNTDGIENM